jgi:hypothetical protein
MDEQHPGPNGSVQNKGATVEGTTRPISRKREGKSKHYRDKTPSKQCLLQMWRRRALRTRMPKRGPY